MSLISFMIFRSLTILSILVSLMILYSLPILANLIRGLNEVCELVQFSNRSKGRMAVMSTTNHPVRYLLAIYFRQSIVQKSVSVMAELNIIIISMKNRKSIAYPILSQNQLFWIDLNASIKGVYMHVRNKITLMTPFQTFRPWLPGKMIRYEFLFDSSISLWI